MREFLKKKEKVLYLIFSQAFFSANSRGGSWAARINIRKSISFSLERLRTLSRSKDRSSFFRMSKSYMNQFLMVAPLREIRGRGIILEKQEKKGQAILNRGGISRNRTRYSDVVSQIFNEESPWIIFSAKNYPCFLQRSRCYHIWEKNQTGP